MKKLIYQKDNSIALIDHDAKIEDSVQPGFLQVVTEYGFLSKEIKLKIDNSVQIPEFEILNQPLFDEILASFSDKAMQISSKIGFIHKMGVLLYGKQGCGKTTFCYQVADFFIKKFDTIAISVSAYNELEFAVHFVKNLRTELNFQKTVVIIMDECEDVMYHGESAMKSMLDSTNSLGNCLMLFTTNYIDKVPETIKDRPSRIKKCVEFKHEDDEIRVFNIIERMNLLLDEPDRIDRALINKLVPQHVDSTVDEIKHAFLDLFITKP